MKQPLKWRWEWTRSGAGTALQPRLPARSRQDSVLNRGLVWVCKASHLRRGLGGSAGPQGARLAPGSMGLGRLICKWVILKCKDSSSCLNALTS